MIKHSEPIYGRGAAPVIIYNADARTCCLVSHVDRTPTCVVAACPSRIRRTS